MFKNSGLAVSWHVVYACFPFEVVVAQMHNDWLLGDKTKQSRHLIT